MVKCTFCGHDESPHTGLHLITNKGETKYFCSRKCRVSALKLKRTESFREAREKARAK